MARSNVESIKIDKQIAWDLKCEADRLSGLDCGYGDRTQQQFMNMIVERGISEYLKNGY